MRQQIRDICSILCGLVVAMDYRKGQKLITDRDFKSNAQFFQDVFEVGRRYKVMNPGGAPAAQPLLCLSRMSRCSCTSKREEGTRTPSPISTDACACGDGADGEACQF